MHNTQHTTHKHNTDKAQIPRGGQEALDGPKGSESPHNAGGMWAGVAWNARVPVTAAPPNLSVVSGEPVVLATYASRSKRASTGKRGGPMTRLRLSMARSNASWSRGSASRRQGLDGARMNPKKSARLRSHVPCEGYFPRPPTPQAHTHTPGRQKTYGKPQSPQKTQTGKVNGTTQKLAHPLS